MGWFKRDKKKGRDGDASGDDDPGTPTPTGAADSGSEPPTRTSESSPQKVGVVSGVLSTSAGDEALADSPFANIVARRFGPPDAEAPRPPGRAGDDPKTADGHGGAPDASDASDSSEAPQRDHARVVEPLFPDHPATPELEVDPMAHIGRATTITGNIVAEEDLEIQGTVEGSVRLANHQVTIGAEGHVKASVEAEMVMVYGRITGDVVASDLVEIEKGGIVGGDIRAPRIVMHDGAIVVGGLDMSAALPNGGANYEPSELPDVIEAPAPDRPRLASVAPPTDESDAAAAAAAADDDDDEATD